MGMPTTGAELMRLMPEMFLPEKAKGVNAVIQFNLSGEGGGAYTVTIADGKCQISEGTAATPTAMVAATAADYLAIVRGELNAVSAFMGGKLKVTGDLNLMMKFLDWFKRP